MKRLPFSSILALCQVTILTIPLAKNGILRLVTHDLVACLPSATRTDPEQFESSMRVA